MSKIGSTFAKTFTPKKTKLFWLYFVVSFFLILLGVVFMPVWGNCGDWCFFKNWWNTAVCLCIAVCILIYLFTYLFKKIKSGSNGAIKVLTIIEFVLMALIAVGCIFTAIPQIRASLNLPTEACKILGIAFYCRGVVELFRAYYIKTTKDYPVWWLVIAIVFVTVGVIMFFKPFFTNQVIAWIFSVVFYLLAIAYIIVGILAKPAGKKKEKASKK